MSLLPACSRVRRLADPATGLTLPPARACQHRLRPRWRAALRYLAVPFSGDFVASLPCEAAPPSISARPGARSPRFAMAFEPDRLIPNDPAMRLVVNYRARAARSDLFLRRPDRGSTPRDLFKGRIVLVGASFIGSADSIRAVRQHPVPARAPPTIVDTILAGTSSGKPAALADDCHRARRGPGDCDGAPAAAAATWLAALVAPCRSSAGGGARSPCACLWLPLVGPGTALDPATAGVLLFRYGFVDQQRAHPSAFRHYLRPIWSMRWRRIPSGLSLAGNPNAEPDVLRHPGLHRDLGAVQANPRS